MTEKQPGPLPGTSPLGGAITAAITVAVDTAGSPWGGAVIKENYFAFLFTDKRTEKEEGREGKPPAVTVTLAITGASE